MSSDAPMTIERVTELHDAGDSPWPKISPDYDLAMIEGLETGTFKVPKSDKTVNMDEIRETGIAASGVSFVPLSQLRDTQNRPVVQGKRYLFRVANSGRDRMTDFEDGNMRRVVNNSKWNGGIFLKLKQRYTSKDFVFKIEYPGRGKWLVGTMMDRNDVILGNDQSTSVWMFQDQGKDNNGFPCYGIWAERCGATEYGQGFWMPDYAIARAGYDGDYEWATYTKTAENGFFNIALERHSYSE